VTTYPFSAIVGQEAMREALLLAAVNPRLGGILIRGEKGTAKSTAVRALADLLPELATVTDCVYGCDPEDPHHWCADCRSRSEAGESLPTTLRRTKVVELPVSATEDRVVGTLDLERALRHGEQRFQPGLLAAANRGILYVDEVNLLDDHLVDVLLDAAAMGVSTVEREGISVSHPARFLLVGTMNPEEGDLRPQLLDRFALCVDVEGVRDTRKRVEIVRRYRAFEEDPEGFGRFWADDEISLREQVLTARTLLPDVVVPEPLLFAIAELTVELGVDGHRADLVIGKAATTLAALAGRQKAGIDDVCQAAPLALSHRMRRRPFEEKQLERERIESFLRQHTSDPSRSGSDTRSQVRPAGKGAAASDRAIPDIGQGGSRVPAGRPDHLTGAPGGDRSVASAPSPDTGLGALSAVDRRTRDSSGRRVATAVNSPHGKTIGSAVPSAPATDVAVAATVRAAASRQALATEGDGNAAIDQSVRVMPEDVRVKVRKGKTGASILICLDASGSMQAEERMAAAKGAVLALLVDAYQRRDRVGLVAFRGERAELVLPLTRSVELARMRLAEVPSGGATPLTEGLALAHEVLTRELRRDPDVVPWVVLLSDGHANVSQGDGLAIDEAKRAAALLSDAGVQMLVVDTSGPSGYGYARQIARAAKGHYVRLDAIEAERLTKLVTERLRAD
jgi:magnesium chelatase subunit D